MTQERGFWDELFRGFENAVTDIRQKVVEEPWFGREVTTAHDTRLVPDAPGTGEGKGVDPAPENDLNR